MIVFVHGGGWRIGDKRPHARRAAAFLPLGFLFVSVNYRLSPEVVHPAHARDVAAAVSWVLDHVGEHGGDPGRVFLMGHSAGAHLAALVSSDARLLAAHGHAPGELAGTVLLDGAGYDIPWLRRLNERSFTRLYRPAFGEDPALLADASPVNHVAPGKGIPPHLVVYVARRMARLQAPRYAARLEEAGVPTRLFLAEGETHASVNRRLGEPDRPLTRALLDFLATAGGPPPPPPPGG